MSLTGRQILEACVLVGWDRREIARRTALPLTVIDRFEASAGLVNITMAQEIAINTALAKAGVEFTAEAPGVRLGKDEQEDGTS